MLHKSFFQSSTLNKQTIHPTTLTKKQGRRKEGIVERTEKKQFAEKSETKIPEKPQVKTCQMIQLKQNTKARILEKSY